jgi:hypothetical protein
VTELDLTAMHWRKSSHSGQGGEDCVELADLPNAVAVRDSKNPDGPRLTFAASEWATFTTAIKANGHDLP